MSRYFRQFIPKFSRIVDEHLHKNEFKIKKFDILLKSRSFLNEVKSYAGKESIRQRLGGALISNAELNLDKFTSLYDRVSGRDVVKNAQADLLRAEKDFVAKQLNRRTLQESLFDIQKKRSDVNKRVKVTSIADDAYLPLITQEHELARDEARLYAEHRQADLLEKAAYENFTSLMRYSHAEERNYDQRMRQWTVIGSVIAAAFSVLVTFFRFRSVNNGGSLDKTSHVQEILSQLANMNENLSSQQKHASQVLQRIAKLESIQETVLTELKKLGASNIENVPNSNSAITKSTYDWFASSVSWLYKGNETKESVDPKPSVEAGYTNYFGWKSIVGTVATVVILAILI